MKSSLQFWAVYSFEPSCWILCWIRMFQLRCRGNPNKRFMFNNFLSENHAVYEIMWKNTVQPDIPQMTTWRKRISKATNTNSEYETHWYFIATMVARTRLSVTLDVDCLSCWI
jgi:hypothetical protein